MHQTDFVVIGGGLFGIYTALFLAEKKYKVCLIEKESELFTKASVVNQARLHSGYHYPRSISTALMAHEHNCRFAIEHKTFINDQFENYYAIDKFSSFTDSAQFERFCRFVQVPSHKIKTHPLFNFEHIEALFLTEEYTFDPDALSRYYTQKISENKNITIILNAKLGHAEKAHDRWQLHYAQATNPELRSIETNAVINATYAGTNSVNVIFGMNLIDLMYEISEVVLVRAPEFNRTGLTVIDGPFTSCIPYGLSGLNSLTSVLYTHHQGSGKYFPEFDCQQVNQACHPDYLSNCNSCVAKPQSNQRKMIAQVKRYLSDKVLLEYQHSLFAIKTKLKSSYIDDGRPTEISKLNADPPFYCLFSGKINSIYEIEKLITNEF